MTGFHITETYQIARALANARSRLAAFNTPDNIMGAQIAEIDQALTACTKIERVNVVLVSTYIATVAEFQRLADQETDDVDMYAVTRNLLAAISRLAEMWDAAGEEIGHVQE